MNTFFRKIIIFLCFLLVFSTSFPCMAQNSANIVSETDSSSETIMTSNTWPEGPSIETTAAVLMEASTGTILYSKNMTDALYPASITKIMTALLAVENCSMNDIVTFSHEAIFNVDMDSSRVGIDEGEELTLEQCLYGMMLESDNQIAYAIAEHVGGSYETFISMMNAKAEELGCQNTHFNNPNGLPDEKHYTCAYDMALILNAAIKNDTFRSIASTRQYICAPTNKQPESRIWNNHHKMFPKKDYTFDGFEGGKTGYTTVALYTLASFAKRDNMELICIVMKSPTSDCQYQNTAALFNFGFDNFQVLNISENESSLTSSQSNITEVNTEIFSSSANINIDSNSNIVLPNSYSFDDVTYDLVTDTTSENNMVATLTYHFADHDIGTATVSITPSSARKYKFKSKTNTHPTEQSSNETEDKKNTSFIKSHLKQIIFIVSALVVLIIFIVVIFLIIRHKRNTIYYPSYRKNKK